MGPALAAAVRWNLWILDSIRDEISTLAEERDVSPNKPRHEFVYASAE
jgi:hypothetical protein